MPSPFLVLRGKRMADDPLSVMQQTMARMEGMLSVVISNHNNRLDGHDNVISALSERQGIMTSRIDGFDIKLHNVDKGMTTLNQSIDNNRAESKTSHDSDVKELTTLIAEVKLNQSGQIAKAFQFVTPIIAIITILMVLGDRLYGGV